MDRIYWTRIYLDKAILLESSKRRGYWKITDMGSQLLAKNLPTINNKILSEFSPQFREWIRSSHERSRIRISKKTKMM